MPPSLIGRQVTVRLHHDRLIVYLGSDWVCRLPRVYGHLSEGTRAWCIDLEYLNDGLSQPWRVAEPISRSRQPRFAHWRVEPNHWRYQRAI